MAQISKEENMIELADKCLILAKSDATAKELMLKFIEIRPELGEKDVKIHVHHVKHKTDYSLYTDEERSEERRVGKDWRCGSCGKRGRAKRRNIKSVAGGAR